MHEQVIAKDVLRAGLAYLAEKKASKIKSIKVSLGEMQIVGHHLSSFENAFAMQAKGTPAEGAKLEVELEPLKAFCNSCKKEIKVSDMHHHQIGCPYCGKEDLNITSGEGVKVLKVEVI
jgi:hydrogenase nickel incorporation protein HypA/HybF